MEIPSAPRPADKPTDSSDPHDNWDFDDHTDDLADGIEVVQSPEVLKEGEALANAIKKLLEPYKEQIEMRFPVPVKRSFSDEPTFLRYIQPHPGQPAGTHNPDKSDWVGLSLSPRFLETNAEVARVEINPRDTGGMDAVSVDYKGGTLLTEEGVSLDLIGDYKASKARELGKIAYLQKVRALIESITVPPEHFDLAIVDPYLE